jgi:CubicO group peptidase (beta-lactamase class C family)
MKTIKRIATAILALATTCATAQQPASSQAATSSPVPVALTAEDANAWLDGYMPYALHTADIAGAVVVIVKDGKILTERGFGFSDVEKRTPVDPERTLFRPGSVSKLVTWTAVMQMVEQGKIDLDADVNKYLDYKIPEFGGKPVTMRNLMQHTAGFEEQVKDIISADPHAPEFDTLLKRWVPERIFAAGTTQAYSNYGASLAGYIVQRVSGEPFDAYVEKHIFEPLEMKLSSFRQPLPANLAPLMSKGYRLASGEPQAFEMVGPAPAGSLSAPGSDMAHFMIAHLQDGEYDGKRILSATTARQMHNSPLTLLPPLNRMELGFFETNINSREVIAHLGDTEYFHTSLHLFMQEGTGFYVSFNSPGRDGAAHNLRTALFYDFADRYFPDKAPRSRLDAKTSAQHAASLAGSWVNSRGSRSNFLAAIDLLSNTRLGLDAQGGLLAPFPGLNGLPRRWVEIAPFVWQDANSHERLAAQVVNGVPVRFSIDLISPFMVFERPAWYRNGTWLRPLFFASIGVLLLTVVFWPITAIVRRRCGIKLELQPRALRAYRLSKIGAVAILLSMTLWGILITLMLTDNTNFGGGMDLLLLTTQLVTIVACCGGFAAMLINLRAVWTGPRRWPAKTWSVVLSVSALTVCWAALVFKLMSVGVNY